MAQARSSTTAEPAEQPGPEARTTPGAKAWGDHPIDIRLSIPLFRGFYLTINAGPERRSAGRLRAERKKHPLLRGANVAFLIVISATVGLASFGLIQFATLMFLRQNGVVDFCP